MSRNVSIEFIKERIFWIRGKKVMLDKDLAELYGVKPIRLREQVKRNLIRFPADFMFQLTQQELDVKVSHFAIPSRKYFGGYLPYVFTEHGIAMLSSVLNSESAIEVNIAIIRIFVQLREMLAAHKELSAKLDELEKKVGRHDKEIGTIFKVIHKLIAEPEPEPQKPRIGFHTK